MWNLDFLKFDRIPVKAEKLGGNVSDVISVGKGAINSYPQNDIRYGDPDVPTWRLLRASNASSTALRRKRRLTRYVSRCFAPMKAHPVAASFRLVSPARDIVWPAGQEKTCHRYPPYLKFRFTHWADLRLDFRIASGLWPDTSKSFVYGP